MTIVNLTPHEVKVGDLTFPASGVIARVGVSNVKADDLTVEGQVISTVTSVYTDVTVDGTLPEADYYIVSGLVADRWLDMSGKLLVPNVLIRDEAGKVIGASNFRRA